MYHTCCPHAHAGCTCHLTFVLSTHLAFKTCAAHWLVPAGNLCADLHMQAGEGDKMWTCQCVSKYEYSSATHRCEGEPQGTCEGCCGAVVLLCRCIEVLWGCGAVVLICCCVGVLHMPRSHVYTSVLTAYPVTASVMHNSRAVSTPPVECTATMPASPWHTCSETASAPFPCRSYNALVHASCRHVQRKATWQEWHRGQVCKCFCGTLPRGHYV